LEPGSARVDGNIIRCAYTIHHTDRPAQESVSRFVTAFDIKTRKDDTHAAIWGRPLSAVSPDSLLFRSDIPSFPGKDLLFPGKDVKLGFQPFVDAIKAFDNLPLG